MIDAESRAEVCPTDSRAEVCPTDSRAGVRGTSTLQIIGGRAYKMGGAREPAQTTTERPRRSLHKHQRCRLGPKNSVSWWDEQHSPISQPHTPNVSLSVTDYPMSSAQWSAALLAQQLPPIHMFTGEEATDGRETFTDWIEQLEMVASIS